MQIQFTELNLQNEHDVIHLFRGNSTRKEDFLISLTGDKLPPTIIVEGGPALLWFLSDEQQQKDGFSIDVKLITDKPARAQ